MTTERKSWTELTQEHPWFQILADGRVVRILPGYVHIDHSVLEFHVPDHELDALVARILQHKNSRTPVQYDVADVSTLTDGAEDCPDAD